MRNIYQIAICNGSVILMYELCSSKDVFKSIRSAKKCNLWKEAIEDKDDKCFKISKEESKKIEWLKPYIEKSVESITFKKEGFIESIMIMKIKCK